MAEYKVLIVDDSTYMRKQIGDILFPCEEIKIVGQAASGEAAIDMAMEKMPDLMTLDNILPDMRGLDVLQALRPLLPKTKYLMISAVGQQSVIDEAFELGVSDYLVKPIDFNRLTLKITEILKGQ